MTTMYMNIVQEEESGEITFYMKGADMVMQSIVQYNDWLDEEVSLSSLSVVIVSGHCLSVCLSVCGSL